MEYARVRRHFPVLLLGLVMWCCSVMLLLAVTWYCVLCFVVHNTAPPRSVAAEDFHKTFMC